MPETSLAFHHKKLKLTLLCTGLGQSTKVWNQTDLISLSAMDLYLFQEKIEELKYHLYQSKKYDPYYKKAHTAKASD